MPPSHWFGFGAQEVDLTDSDLRWRTHYLQAPIPGLDESGIASSAIQLSAASNSPEVLIEFREPAAAIFAQLTSDNVGQKIVLSLDERVIFDVTVGTKIRGGSVVISAGSQTRATDKALRELVERIQTGPLSIQMISFTRIASP